MDTRNNTDQVTYIDGVSLTHGSPRHHVWTFASVHDQALTFGPHPEYTSRPCLNPVADAGFIEGGFCYNIARKAREKF